MPTSKVSGRSASFNGRGGGTSAGKLRRPRTVPDLMSWERNSPTAPTEKTKLTKVLLNVTVQGSVGAVHVILSPELNVSDLICAVLKQYLKEGRRPMITGFAVDDFDLHFSQFSLERLGRDEKIAMLGSRNFFLCKRKTALDGAVLVASCSTEAEETALDGAVLASSCSTQAEKAAMIGMSFSWLKFMSFMF